MSSVEQARTLATRYWRGEMPRRPGKLSGLNGVMKVRLRLHTIAYSVSPDLEIAGALRAIDYRSAPMDEILSRTEQLLAYELSAFFPTPHTLLDALGASTWPLVDLIAVQSIGARQGHWLARTTDSYDARIARELARDVPPYSPDRHAQVIANARHAQGAGNYEDAVAWLWEADHGERHPVTLMQLSVALWRAQKIPHALHAIRACLLEEPESFPTADAYLSAARVESSLRRLLENVAGTSAADHAALQIIHDAEAKPSYSPRARVA